MLNAAYAITKIPIYFWDHDGEISQLQPTLIQKAIWKNPMTKIPNATYATTKIPIGFRGHAEKINHLQPALIQKPR